MRESKTHAVCANTESDAPSDVNETRSGEVVSSAWDVTMHRVAESSGSRRSRTRSDLRDPEVFVWEAEVSAAKSASVNAIEKMGRAEGSEPSTLSWMDGIVNWAVVGLDSVVELDSVEGVGGEGGESSVGKAGARREASGVGGGSTTWRSARLEERMDEQAPAMSREAANEMGVETVAEKSEADWLYEAETSKGWQRGIRGPSRPLGLRLAWSAVSEIW